MKPFSRMLWLAISLAVLAAVSIGVARFEWERKYDDVALAVPLGDLYKISPANIDAILQSLERSGPQILTISPQEVPELHQQFFPSAPAEASIPWEELKRLRERGFLIFWRLDMPITMEELTPFLDKLFELQSAGLLLSRPFDISSGNLELLLALLHAHSPLVGFVEFDTPAGVEQLYRQGYHDVVRVHTMKIEERAAKSEREVIDRYLRAVTERNVRFLELRALTPDQIIADYAALQDELGRAHFRLALPAPPAPFAPSVWALALLWLGFVSVLVLSAERINKLPLASLALLWVIGALLGLVGLFEWRELLMQGAAWLTAVVVPIATFVFLSKHHVFSRGSGLLFTLVFSMASILGGLTAAAFLSTDTYFLHIQEFPGVKAAFVLPILGIALLSARSVEWRSFRAFDAAVWAALGAVIILVLIRSGNFPIWPASEPELTIRGWLEDSLIIRPRLKEFLIGHPLLLLWGGLGAIRWRPWAFAILLAGLLGQISIVNSFEHLHTPLYVTLVRTAHGLWIGLALGWSISMLARRFLRRFPISSVD